MTGIATHSGDPSRVRLAAEVPAATIRTAAVETAKANTDRRSIIIGVAIPIIRTPWSIDSIAAPIIRPSRGTRLIARLVGGLLIVAGADVTKGLRCAIGRNHDRILYPES